MSKHITLLLLLVAAALYGCATPQPPATLSLVEVSRNDYLVIDRPMAFRRTGGMIKTTVEFGVLPGTYTARKENDLGVFYFGRSHSLWSKVLDDKQRPYQLREGGIWVSKAPSIRPRLFWIAEASLHIADTLDLATESVKDPNAETLNRIVVSKTEEAANIGKPVGPAAVGSIAGTAIVHAAILADVGNVSILDESGNAEFDETLLVGLHSSAQSR